MNQKTRLIRPKVASIIKNKNRLLVCEVMDEEGKLKGWCPLGGGIEFGETFQEALRREMREELGCEIEIGEGPIVCENLYEYEGVKGHEIVMGFHVEVKNLEIYTKKRFQIQEDQGSFHWVEWIDLEDFYSKKERLFPSNLIFKI
jgi:ADP-ribose pyrophosphatase YjhB (NUDIX family)